MFAVAWLAHNEWHFHVVTDNLSYAHAELTYCRDMLGLPAKLFTRN